MASFWLATGWSAILCVPMVIYGWTLLHHLPFEWWVLLMLSGFCQMAYLIGLTMAYQRAELSLMYPLIRSSPLLLLLIGSVLLGTHTRVSVQAMVGIILIVAGCIVLPMQHWRDLRLQHYLNPATAFALLAATATAGYSLVDDQATRWMRALGGDHWHAAEIALLYVVLQAWAAWLWLTLAVLIVPAWRIKSLRLGRPVHSTAAYTGMLMLLTYALVVWAMAYARDVSYVVAFRQVSILIGVGMGIFWLHEQPSHPRIAGVATVFIGLVLVSIGSR